MLLQCDLMGDDYLVRVSFVILYFILLTIWIIKKKSFLSNLMLLLTILYLHELFVLLLLPIPISAKCIESFKITTAGTPYFNIIPFKDIITFLYNSMKLNAVGMMVRNIIGNIICFIPFGFLFPCLNKSFLNLKKFLLLALLVPISVELVQLIISLSIKVVYRFADIDDVILNFTGILIGFELLKLTAKFFKKRFKIDIFEILFRRRKSLHL